MQNTQHQNLVGFIWNIANKLRGPYRPPQYRRVMLPLIVLRRFDLVLAENKQKVLAEKQRLEDRGITGPAMEKALSRIATKGRKQELFNTSGFSFESLLGDAPNIAGNLIAYIQGFSPRARDIFDPKSGSSTRRRKRFRCYPRQQRAGDFCNHIVQKRLPSVSFGQLLRNGFYMTQGLLNIVDECNQGVFCGVHGGQIHGSLAAMFDRSTNSGEQ